MVHLIQEKHFKIGGRYKSFSFDVTKHLGDLVECPRLTILKSLKTFDPQFVSVATIYTLIYLNINSSSITFANMSF